MNPTLRTTLATTGAALRRRAWFPLAVFATHEFCAHAIDAYRRWPAIDIPLHFLGGFAIAFFAAGALDAFAARRLVRDPDPLLRLLLLFAGTCTAALFWEFAEWIADRFFGTNCQMGDLGDTLLDQCMGMAGGLVFVLPQLPAALRFYFRPAQEPSP